jgi:hypothetical protein
VAHLAFCANCRSDKLRVGSPTSRGTELSCYACTAKFTLQGVILGEVDFLAGAKQRIDQMVQRPKEKARGASGGTMAPARRHG